LKALDIFQGGSKATVTTEHQDLSQTRRFFNQPNIPPTNTSSIINRISRTADLHSTIKHSIPAYLNPCGYLPTMKQGSTRSPLNTIRIQLNYQLRPTYPTRFNRIRLRFDLLHPFSDKLPFPNEKTKGFNRIQQKQLRRLVWFFSILDCGSVSFSYIYLGN
jgi:hypothetical protein